MPKRESFVLGRDDDCDLTLGSDEVSGRHAEIVRELVEADHGAGRPRFAIRDLGSTNGTAVNGHRLVGDEQRKIDAGEDHVAEEHRAAAEPDGGAAVIDIMSLLTASVARRQNERAADADEGKARA